MSWQDIKESLWALAAVAFLIKFWRLDGQVHQFFTNHWPSHVKQVNEMHTAVHKNSERLARLEGEK